VFSAFVFLIISFSFLFKCKPKISPLPSIVLEPNPNGNFTNGNYYFIFSDKHLACDLESEKLGCYNSKFIKRGMWELPDW